MIVVDSSVWIAHFRKAESSALSRLRKIEDPSEILVGDIILLEVLQGTRDEKQANLIAENLRQFVVRSMLTEELAIKAARNYRLLKERGITVRKTIDMIIATFCIEQGHKLLHEDRDFDSITKHLDLQIA